jgi:predicted nuclease of predicted toxin-antitoxin system
MAEGPVLRFLTDNNVPDPVGDWLRDRGHDVERVRDVMADNTPDAIVAGAAIRSERILISWDKDFNAQRFKTPRFAPLQRIAFACEEQLGVPRLETLIDRLEYECVRSSSDDPILIRIGPDKFTIHR